MNFNAVILILAGIVEIARIAEKLAQRLYGKQTSAISAKAQRSRSLGAARINRTRFYLLSAIAAIES